MALGGQVTNPTIAVTMTGVLTFTCLVDAHVNVSPSTPLPMGQSGMTPTYFVMTCPTCGTRYLIEVNAGQIGCSVTQTS